MLVYASWAHVLRILKMGGLWVCQWVGPVTIIRLSRDTSMQWVVNIIVAAESRKRPVSTHHKVTIITNLDVRSSIDVEDCGVFLASLHQWWSIHLSMQHLSCMWIKTTVCIGYLYWLKIVITNLFRCLPETSLVDYSQPEELQWWYIENMTS